MTSSDRLSYIAGLDGIDLKQFWLRRARRLLPAVGLLLPALPRLHEVIPAALFYITNWVHIVREVPYFESFGRPPLLQQLRSLVVEEQFYLLWPLLLLFLLPITKSNRYGLLFATLSMIALATIWMAVLYSPDADLLRVYHGTDTRAGRFLVGAILAMSWSPWQRLQKTGSGFADLLGGVARAGDPP